MSRRYAEAEKQYWFQAKAAGRNRFIRREVLENLLFWLISITALDLFVFRNRPFSTQSVLIDLIMLPVFLLEGFLRGKWRWRDLDKKYP